MNRKNKNILVCVCGLTPQIVSETFYCLCVQKKIIIDELYILTTKRGRDVILGNDKAESTPKTMLINELEKLCNMYKIPFPKFENNDAHIIVAKEESLELSDIRTDKHNILFPNKVCEFIRKVSLDAENILYCSISGGRKTMSVHLSLAMSLFGRGKDKLLHVLTSEENEFRGFYPISLNQDKALELSEIPYVRLRSIISSYIPSSKFAKMKYDEIVTLTQKMLKKTYHKGVLRFKTDTKEINFEDSSIRLEPLEFAIYYFFAENKTEKKNEISIHEICSIGTAQRILSFLKTYYPYYDSKSKIKKPWWNHGFSPEDIRTKIIGINKKILSLINDPELGEIFIISSFRSYGNTSYGIKADKNKFRLPLPY